MGTVGSYPVDKEAGSVKLTTHLHLVRSEVKVWSMELLPQHVFMAWCSIKNRDNFTFGLLCINDFEDTPRASRQPINNQILFVGKNGIIY
jgi:hypothetical protein